MMNNGLMWVFTGDSDAAFMEEFQTLARMNGGEGLWPAATQQVCCAEVPDWARWGLDLNAEMQQL